MERSTTVLNLDVVKIDAERGLIMVKGAVPGAKGGWVLIRDAIKRTQPEDLPFPGAVKGAGEEGEAEAPAEDAGAPAEAAAPAEEQADEEAPAEDAAGEDEEKKEQ